jgi:hypothetical protein
MWLARPQDEGQNRFKGIMKRKLRPLTRRSRKELFSLLTTTLPIGQYRVAKALIADTSARTYSAVAAELGMHLGTVHQHMRRIRLQRPNVYAAIMKERGRQLAARHRRALARARAHTQAWYEIASRVGGCVESDPEYQIATAKSTSITPINLTALESQHQWDRWAAFHHGAQGVVTATVQAIPMSGFWDEDAQKLTLLLEDTSNSEVYTGYLFTDPINLAGQSGSVIFTLAGFVECFQPISPFVAATAKRSVFGWYAQIGVD